MRGSDVRSGELFSYVDLEKRVPAKHPLRLVRVVVNEVLSRLDGDFSKAYAIGGRPSIAPERLLRPAARLIHRTFQSTLNIASRLALPESTADEIAIALVKPCVRTASNQRCNYDRHEGKDRYEIAPLDAPDRGRLDRREGHITNEIDGSNIRQIVKPATIAI